MARCCARIAIMSFPIWLFVRTAGSPSGRRRGVRAMHGAARDRSLPTHPRRSRPPGRRLHRRGPDTPCPLPRTPQLLCVTPPTPDCWRFSAPRWLWLRRRWFWSHGCSSRPRRSPIARLTVARRRKGVPLDLHSPVGSLRSGYPLNPPGPPCGRIPFSHQATSDSRSPTRGGPNTRPMCQG